MRGWIKALPLGLILPVMLWAASVKPEDAASNISAWAKWGTTILYVSIEASRFVFDGGLGGARSMD